MSDGIYIDNGDAFEVTRTDDGFSAIKIENRAWIEEPRWIEFGVTGKYDRARAIDELIAALVELRDEGGRA